MNSCQLNADISFVYAKSFEKHLFKRRIDYT